MFVYIYNWLEAIWKLYNTLSEDLGKARITVHSIEQFYDFPSKQDYEIKGIVRWDCSLT